MIKTKRIYDDFNYKDGIRVYVDRFWPKGVSKEQAHLSLWISEIAPSIDLAKWFSQDKNKWKDYKEKYFNELTDKDYFVYLLRQMSIFNNLTLLHSSKDKFHNNAILIKEFLTVKNERNLKN